MPARVDLSFLRANGMTIVEKKAKESHLSPAPRRVKHTAAPSKLRINKR